MFYTLYFFKKTPFEKTLILLLNVLLFFAFTRGFFQLFMPKAITMALQMGWVGLITAYLFLKIPLQKDEPTHYCLLVVFTFCLTVIISALWTIVTSDSIKWFFYFLFTALFLLKFLFFLNLLLRKTPLPCIHEHLLYWAYFLFFIAFLEHLKWINMPGHSYIAFFVRPASTTGSMLHYPIVMALFGGIFFSLYQITKEKKFWRAGLMGMLIPFIVLSRSGIFIVLASLVFWYLQLSFISKKLFFKITLTLFIILFTLFSIFAYLKTLSEDEESTTGVFIDRVISVFEKRAKGNNIRLTIWSEVIKEWKETNLLFGEKTGEYTNATSFLNKEGKGKVSESSILQQLMNFGLLGTLSFYLLLSLPLFIMKRSAYMYRGVYLAGLMQTAFLQSIEVISYMTLLLFIPVLSTQKLETRKVL